MNFEELTNVVGELDEERMVEILEDVMKDGGSDAQEAMDACQKGMDTIGELFNTGEYFVSDLIFAGELMTEAVEILRPALAGDGGGSDLGKMILCTVQDDLHDIGKNIVKAMLETAGFEVIDLGVDTPVQKIVDTAKENNIHIIALSGVLTLAIDSMKKTVDAVHEAGLDAKIIVGGSPVNEQSFIATGADAWAYAPQDTVKTCKSWAAA